jgi:hypothetical protein
MSDRQAETITIAGNTKYAKVSTRVAEFHKDHETCQVDTSCDFKEGFVLFTVTVTTKKGTFTGHSMGKASGKNKEFEKQETIALGRALAFAGYLASGEIATYEEMQDVANSVTLTQYNSLKMKYATEFADSMKGMDRPSKQQQFHTWCRDLINEEVDYNDHTVWEPEWIKTCWQELTGHDPSVPFDSPEDK